MQDFAGKVAVITGAASGIGKALTEKCIAEGMHVVMADIEAAVLEDVAAELQATTNNQVLPIVTNVAIEAEFNGVGASTRKYVLCRCGQSKNKPFCDGTHHDVGWTDD